MPDQSADLYPQMGGPREAASPEPTEEGTGENDSQDTGGETALLPKSILAGKDFKPGEEVVLKIVRIHDDEVEVQYAPDKHEESESEEEPESADSEIDRMSMMGSKKGY